MSILNKFLVKPKEEGENKQWPQIFAVLVGCITAFVSGLNIAWTSPSILKLTTNQSHISMTFDETSYFNVVHPLAMSLFCPFCAIIIDIVGYKNTILLISIPQLGGLLLIGFSVNATMLYVSKIFVGISDAAVYFALPVYIGEVSEKNMRGPLGCAVVIYFYLGQMFMNALGYYVDINMTGFICCIFPILFFFIFLRMPESPYWLIEKERIEEAKKHLQMLRWRENVDEELNELMQAVKRQLSEKNTMKDIFKIRSNRKSLFMALSTRLAQQFAGMTSFFVYLQYIFKEAGGNIESHISSIICMGLLAIGAIVSTFLINKFGRRSLLLVSSAICSLILFIQAFFFYFKDQYDLSNYGWFPLVSMIVYIIAFSFGLCVVPNVIVGELFSASIKKKAMVIVNFVFGLYILSASKIFHLLDKHYGLYAPFAFFAIFTVVVSVFIYFTLIETKNKTLEEIQMVLKKPNKSKTVTEVSNSF